MRFDRWLAARDAASVRSAWLALAPVHHTVTQIHREITPHGAAQLAAAMLGERPDWLLELEQLPADAEHDAIVGACFVDDAWDLRERCREAWRIRERGGVQVATVSCGTIEGRPEGAACHVVRIVDRDRAASLVLGTRKVSTIGSVDLAPLDLYRFSHYFSFASEDAEDVPALRGLVAQLASELDAHYDTSPLWPRTGNRFGDDDRSVLVGRDPYGRTMATVHGLPWGHQLAIQVGVTQGYVFGQLPDADIDRVLARLAKT